MFDQLIKSISESPEITAAIGAGIAYAASELIGISKLKSSGLLHLLFNIGKGIMKASIKKEGK